MERTRPRQFLDVYLSRLQDTAADFGRAKGVSAINMQEGVPVIFGVLTTDTIEQAIERAGTKAGNKGWDAAASAIEMANLMKQI